MNTGQDGYNRCLQEQHKYCDWGYWCLYLGLEYDTECTQDAVHCHVDESRLLHLLVDINHSKKKWWLSRCEGFLDQHMHCILMCVGAAAGRPYTSTDEKRPWQKKKQATLAPFFFFCSFFCEAQEVKLALKI